MARIVIIEDEPGITLMLTEMLTEEGHTVLSAPNGNEGLALLKRQKDNPDVAFVDLHMPGLSGKAVIEHMYADPLLRSIPVVIMTGFVPAAKNMPPRASYRAILSKPFDLNHLLAYVRMAVEGNTSFILAAESYGSPC
jgi:CheY-like chemotaxis protein